MSANFPTGVFRGERRRRRRGTLAGSGRAVIVGVGLLVLLLVASQVVPWVYANRTLSAIGVAGLGDGPSTEAPDGTRNTLLITSDASGVDMVAVVQQTEADAQPDVLLLPLALELLRPGDGQLATVAALRDEDGPELLVAAVEDYTGIPLDHVVDVDLPAFGELVDVVGDVRACVPSAPEQVEETVKVSPECPVLDSDTVMRSLRLDDEDGADLFQRFEIRRTIAAALAERLRAGTFRFRPFRAMRAADALAAAVFTNRDPGVRGLFSLAADFDDEATTPADTRVVPGFRTSDGDVIEPYPDQAQAIFTAFQNASPLPPEIGLSPPTALEPSEIRVLVLNGVGTPGLGASMAAFLSARGFQVLEPANVDTFDPTQRNIFIRHTPTTRPEAGLVADLIPGALLEEVATLDGGVPVVVVVGSDWDT